MKRPPKRVVQELESTGLDYNLEQGTKHLQIRICGRFVGIIPTNCKATEGRAMLNVISQIRRAAKEIKNG